MNGHRLVEVSVTVVVPEDEVTEFLTALMIGKDATVLHEFEWVSYAAKLSAPESWTEV